MEKSDDNLIKFEPGISIKPKRRRRLKCLCRQVVLDERTRMIVCENCGAVQDPFDFLWSWACKEDGYEYRRDRLKDEINKLSPELEDLKREERNIKARIKTAKKKLP